MEIIKSLAFEKIHNDELRKFSCWGSVEVKDRQKEIIPADEVYKFMDIWMDRGAPIMYNHTNRQVGRGLNWQPLEKNGKKGVLITGTIFKHYAEDDEIWNSIKDGEFEGLSLGGKNYTREETEEGTILRDLIGYEFSVVERCGNQEATFQDINLLAKSDVSEKKMVEKKEIKKEEIVDVQTEETNTDDFKNSVLSAINKITERLDEIEEKISGGASNDSPMEEQKMDKPEEEEKSCKKEEEKEEDKKEMEKEEKEEKDKEDKENIEKKLSEFKKSFMSDFKKEITDLKKSMVKEIVKTERPEDVKVEEKEDIMKSIDKKIESGKFSFKEINQMIKKAGDEKLNSLFNQ